LNVLEGNGAKLFTKEEISSLNMLESDFDRLKKVWDYL